MLPYYPMEDNGAFHWEIYSYSNKMIADYCIIASQGTLAPRTSGFG